ncbi:DUF5712 family protein [Spirosoma utsteinense]|uniref:Mobilization protein n=1 Tax=Spirosoma utsteinense TaxID=2585773 RepID=A0ABR6WGC2_9BACT|nr:DUF5712 family protein [Spirosoma utsteinense]MBC3789150.1 hypothetical protein [Spirosoma utsteinense]MBC3795070.1 hypothetical protein [Spirosoma utsteinense]
MPHINITASSTGSNAGSCGQLVEYLEKENNLKAEHKAELWFNQGRDDLRPYEVRQGIDSNTAKLKQHEAKFYLVNISPSQKELAHLGNDPQQLKEYARGVMAEYAANFQKGLGPDDVKWYGKVEYNRGYKWTDPAVQQGLSQRGELKAGPQLHIQIIVSRKDMQNQRLLSPLTNHRGQGKSEAHGHKFGQFNRVEFKERSERAFDTQLNYRRDLEESFRYQNTMSNGTAQERAAMTLELRDTQHERQQQLAADLRRAEELRLEQAQKVELSHQRELSIQQEQRSNRGMSLGM